MGGSATILWGFLFGTIGIAYLVYGKKQRRGFALAVGVALILLPYFVSDPYSIVLIGGALMAVPYFIRD